MLGLPHSIMRGRDGAVIVMKMGDSQQFSVDYLDLNCGLFSIVPLASPATW